MRETGSCLSDSFRDRFIRSAARVIDFIILVARAHRYREAVRFLDALRRALG